MKKIKAFVSRAGASPSSNAGDTKNIIMTYNTTTSNGKKPNAGSYLRTIVMVSSLFIMAINFKESQWLRGVVSRGSSFPATDADEPSGNYGLPSHLAHIQQRVESWQEAFPGCAALVNESKVLKFEQLAITTASPYEPRYTHISNIVLKARYNCVGTKNASSYHIVYQKPGSTEVCDVRALTDYIQGPTGVALSLLKEKQQQQPHLPKSKQVINIAIHGNSFLRQIWESFVGSWMFDMTNLIVGKDGPDISIGGLAARNGTKIPASDFGPIVTWRDLFGPNVTLPLPRDYNFSTALGCHAGPARDFHFWKKGVEMPINLPSCDDNVAMVEFNHMVRIFQIFRPFVYENQQELYDRLGLQAADIDVLILNNKEDETYPFIDQLRPGVWENKIVYPTKLVSLMLTTQKDVGAWLGANNPGIYKKKPDEHPCQPGLPDDEANLILFNILTRTQTSFGAPPRNRGKRIVATA